ncbi:MAG: hypothetical protein OXG83_04935 [Acidobacteria bacterium]|nr:hypothetical protein [Acidobacteriota bacterium]
MKATVRLDRRLGLMSEKREFDVERLLSKLIEKSPPDEIGWRSSTFATIVSFSVTAAPSSWETDGLLSLFTLVLTPSTRS